MSVRFGLVSGVTSDSEKILSKKGSSFVEVEV